MLNAVGAFALAGRTAIPLLRLAFDKLAKVRPSKI
jgi:hypothetical protein